MTAMTKLRIAILTKLSAGDMSTREIALACDRTPAELGITLSRLIGHGLICCVGIAASSQRGCKPRIFSITEKGRQALESAPLMVGKSDLARAKETERQKARKAGLRKYMGKPCPYGHNGIRYVSNSICVQCAFAHSEAQQARRAAA